MIQSKFSLYSKKLLRILFLLFMPALIYFGIAYQIYRYAYDSVRNFGSTLKNPIGYQGGIKTSSKGFTLKQFQLRDAQGTPILEIPEMQVELGWWIAKIQTVRISNPKTRIEYLPNGQWNWNFLPSKTAPVFPNQTAPKISTKKQFEQLIASLQPLLDRQACFILESGEVCFEANEFLDKPFFIRHITLQLRRNAGLLPSEDCYDLQLSLQTDLIEDLVLVGSYSPKEGINLSSEKQMDIPFTRVIRLLNPKLPLVHIWQQLGLQGELHIVKLKAQGLNDQTEDIQLACEITAPLLQYQNLQVKNFAIDWMWQSDYVCIQSLQWEFAGALFKLSNPAQIQLSSLQILQPFSVTFQNLKINKDLIFSMPGLEEIWEALQPEGFLSGEILLQDNLKKIPRASITSTNMKAIFEEVPYPVAVKSAELSFEGDCLTIEKITAQSQSCNAEIEIKGKVWPIEKPYPIAYDVQFNIKNLALDQAVYEAFANEPEHDSWLKDLESIWDNLRPQGLISIKGNIAKKRGNYDPPDFLVKVMPQNARVCYEEFPYAVENVSGIVQIQRGLVKFNNMQASKGKGKLYISGRILAGDQGLDVNLKVNGQQLPLDMDLANALGIEYCEVWKQFNPYGNFNIVVQLNKRANSKKLQWQADVDLKNVTACYDEFPYRIHNICGRLQLSPDNFVFQNLTGIKGQGQVQIQGFLRKAHLKLQIMAKNIPLNDELYQAVPQEARKIWQDFSCFGYIGGAIQIERANEKKPLLWQADLEFSKLAGFYKPFRYSVTDGQGKLLIKPNFCELQSFTAKHQQATIQLNGKFSSDLFDLSIHGTTVPLDAELYQTLSKDYQEIWDQFSPQGAVTMQCNLTKSKNQDLKTTLWIIPQNCEIRYKKFPYPLRQLTTDPKNPQAGVHIYEGNVDFDDLISTHDQTQIKLKGSFQNIQTVKQQNLIQRSLDMQVTAKNLPVDQELRLALSEFFPGLMSSLEPEGKIQQCSLKLANHFGDENYFQYQILLHRMNVKMQKDSLLQSFSGNIQLNGYSYLDKNHLQGQIIQSEVMFSNLTIKNWYSELKYFQDYLLLHNMTGTFYNGALEGNLVLDTSPYTAYKGFLTIKDANLKLLEQAFAKDPQAESTMSGLLTAEVFFQGNRQSTDTLTGKGRIILKDGEIWQLPIFLAMIDIFSLPSHPAFREGVIQFGLLNSQINITSMRLESSLLSISGEGTIGLDGRLALTLLTHFSSDLIPRIPFVDRVINNLSSDIFSLSVQGTLSQPAIDVKQWDQVKNLFDTNKEKQ